MQPVDRQDKRKPYIQIAASIRAAILSGELEPGQQLPVGEELARFFGVTRTTVASAMRVLGSEGFVRSTTGSGVYVREQAALPLPAGEAHELAGVASYLHEAGHLKNIPRAGWLLLAIQAPESVAEHSHRVTLAGIILAALGGADVGRVAAMCALHDMAETRTGDVPSVGRAYVTTAKAEAVTAHQVAGMPDELGKVIQGLVTEFEAGGTLEAQLAKDADRLETLLTAREYAAQGYDTAEWQRTSTEALRTEAGQQLAQAISLADPRWWQAFAASYHELRATAKQRAQELESRRGEG